jgi:hypothetical protein
MKITVEAPSKKNDIVTCTQDVTVTGLKTNCARPYTCVRCRGEHNTTLCKEIPNTPAKCALYSSNQPVNYKGCDIYTNLPKARSKTTIQPRQNFTQSRNTNININNNNQFHPLNKPPVPTPANQQTLYFQILIQNLQSHIISDQPS